MRKVSTFFSDFNQKDMVIPIKIVSFVIELNYSNTMYGKMKEFLSQTLAEIKEAGLYKEERLIESAQQAAITVKGKEVLNFCANNYLGLSNHPRLINQSWVIGQSQIVVSAEVQHFLAFNSDGSLLRTFNQSFFFVKPGFLDFSQCLAEEFFHFTVHSV